jgi:hypothetical protein
MKNNEQIIKELSDRIILRTSAYFNQPLNQETKDGIKMNVKEIFNQFRTDTINEINNKICEVLELKVGDMPAFPPKEIDIIGLSLLIGKEKIKRKLVDEIRKEVESKKTDEKKIYYFGIEPNCYGAETYQDKMLVNAVLEDIKTFLNNLDK